MEYFDISPLINSDLAVYPGDKPFCQTTTLSFKNGDPLYLSSMEGSLHLGAHTDAPCHYSPEGDSMEDVSLEPYLGEAQVIRVDLPRGERIEVAHLNEVSISASRVLFRTGSFPDPNRWNDDFNALSPELVHYLAQKKVQLVGIDTPSVDLAHCKKLISHQEIFKNKMAILEGIVLDNVPNGIYSLVALPLKIKGGDASPVRAILLKVGQS